MTEEEPRHRPSSNIGIINSFIGESSLYQDYLKLLQENTSIAENMLKDPMLIDIGQISLLRGKILAQEELMDIFEEIKRRVEEPEEDEEDAESI